MKKLIVILLAMLIVATPLSALGEAVLDMSDGLSSTPEPQRISSEEFGEFVVGATTKLNGDFFTNMWGNNTCDIDVRHLLHGLQTVFWDVQPAFQPNPTVLSGLSASVATNGDKTYTISLQPDLLYSDGSQIRARDYVFGLLLLAAPQIAQINGMTTNIGFIVGYEDFAGGATEYFSGIRLVDDYTFTITIKAENLPFFFELGMIEAFPYPIQVIAPGCEIADDGQGAYIRNIDQTAPPIFTAETLRQTILDPDTGYMSHPYVTSGPYMLVSFDWETRIARFKINPYFKGSWNGSKPTIDNVVFKSVLPGEMMDEITNGDVHLLNKIVSGDDITEGLSADNIANQNYPRLGFGFINFSCEKADGPAQFENVREAVAYSMDVDNFVAEYTQAYGIPVYGYYGVGQWMVRLISGLESYGSENWTLEQLDALAGLSMDDLNQYTIDLNMAEQLLIEDGWTLNELGQPFAKGTDALRHKLVDGQLMPLTLKWGKMKDSVAANILERMLVPNLEQIGMSVEITEVPFVELLEHYYRQREREFDIMYLATDFISIFDPYFVFNTADEYQGHQNTTGYRDASIQALALNLRRTEPGSLLEYCQKWMAFQKYFNDKLPMLPLYSNIYFDFYTPYLQGYDPQKMSWPIALIDSYLAQPVEAPDEITVADTEDLAATVDDTVDSGAGR